MTSIASIDTSIYSGLVENLSSYIPTRNALDTIVPTVKSEETSATKVDLSRYYSNIRPEDLLKQTGENVARSAEDLDNAMVSAIEYGFSVNDAVKIGKAKAAYQANCTLFNIANEMAKSTFEIAV